MAHSWSRAVRVASTTIALTGLAATQGVARAAESAHPVYPTKAVPANIHTPAFSPPTPVPVAYSCYVTFPGGSTHVNYSLTFGAGAPVAAHWFSVFQVVLQPPSITPNPALQSQVQDVAVAYRVPANTLLVAYWLSGGSSPATVEIRQDVIIVKAPGPFPAGAPFQLPALTMVLWAVNGGPAQTSTGGTSYSDPSFSWTRTDLQGTLRPFDCQPPVPVVFTTTTVAAP